MLKKLFTSSVLAVCCSFAQAADTPGTWTFTWTGFNDFGTFRTDLSYSGSFTGTDANHNGILELSELTSFGIDATGGGAPNLLNCASGTFPSATCYVSAFSYVIGGQLQFGAGRTVTYDYGDDYPQIVTRGYETGYGISMEFQQGMHDEWGVYSVTPGTVMTVQQTLAPVPEPQAYAMLGAGLLMLAGLRSRKKKQ